MNNEGIHLNKDGSLKAMVGKDAMHLMRVNTIIRGIDMYIKSGGKMILTRGATITALLNMASEYTGRKYKRTEKEAALKDLKEWASCMRSALPVTIDGEGTNVAVSK